MSAKRIIAYYSITVFYSECKTLEILFRYFTLNGFRDIDITGNDLTVIESTEIESVADNINPILIPVGIPNAVLGIFDKTVCIIAAVSPGLSHERYVSSVIGSSLKSDIYMTCRIGISENAFIRILSDPEIEILGLVVCQLIVGICYIISDRNRGEVNYAQAAD